MRLESSIVVRCLPDDVWRYFSNVSNIAAWDRGVSGTEITSTTSSGEVLEFDTFAHPRDGSDDGSWGKMSYRIAETDPVLGCTVQLTSRTGNARYFKSAEWRFRVEPEPGGSRVFCAAVFRLKWRYLILVPVLLGMKKAIRNDLEQLRRRLEGDALTPP